MSGPPGRRKSSTRVGTSSFQLYVLSRCLTDNPCHSDKRTKFRNCRKKCAEMKNETQVTVCVSEGLSRKNIVTDHRRSLRSRNHKENFSERSELQLRNLCQCEELHFTCATGRSLCRHSGGPKRNKSWSTVIWGLALAWLGNMVVVTVSMLFVS